MKKEIMNTFSEEYKKEHYFLGYEDVCCVKCGLNWRFLLYEPQCKREEIIYKDDGFGDNSFIMGREIIRHDIVKLKSGFRQRRNLIPDGSLKSNQ